MVKLILFDIDGTLAKGNSHLFAFEKAFKKFFDVDAKVTREYVGMTDWNVILSVLSNAGIPRERVEAKLKECMEEIVSLYRDFVKDAKIELFPGVKELLDMLEKEGFILGLLTGNLSEVAKAKLSNAGIYHYFKTGGFGEDSPNRFRLVDSALERLEKPGITKRDVVIIGDTPLDIKAAKDAGVKAIAVCTGEFSREELMDSGAEHVLDGLSDTEKTISMIKDV